MRKGETHKVKDEGAVIAASSAAISPGAFKILGQLKLERIRLIDSIIETQVESIQFLLESLASTLNLFCVSQPHVGKLCGIIMSQLLMNPNNTNQTISELINKESYNFVLKDVGVKMSDEQKNNFRLLIKLSSEKVMNSLTDKKVDYEYIEKDDYTAIFLMQRHIESKLKEWVEPREKVFQDFLNVLVMNNDMKSIRELIGIGFIDVFHDKKLLEIAESKGHLSLVEYLYNLTAKNLLDKSDDIALYHWLSEPILKSSPHKVYSYAFMKFVDAHRESLERRRNWGVISDLYSVEKSAHEPHSSRFHFGWRERSHTLSESRVHSPLLSRLHLGRRRSHSDPVDPDTVSTVSSLFHRRRSVLSDSGVSSASSELAHASMSAQDLSRI